MPRPTIAVSRQVRRALLQEAGGKCANPGCAATRTHVHHAAFKVYSTNDQTHLIALCPACHDAVHAGELRIDDATIYRWKRLDRVPDRHAHIYVEPGESTKLLLGSVAVTGPAGVVAFDLSSRNRLSFSVAGSGEIMLVELAVTSSANEELVTVDKGHLRVKSEKVAFLHRPGRVLLTAPLTDDFLPTWALNRLRVQEPDYAADQRCTMLGLEVLEPGLVRVEGIWAEARRVIVCTTSRLAFISPGMNQPLSLVGEGANSTLFFAGPIKASLFGFD